MLNPKRICQITQHLINQERKRRGIPPALYNQKLYHLAKDQSNKMARAGRLIHSGRPALRGGENCWMGRGYRDKALPKAIVDSWMKSRDGHREWLLDPKVKTAAVAISKSRHGTFAAWSFSDQPLVHMQIHWRRLKGISGWLYKLSHITYTPPRKVKGKVILPAIPHAPRILSWLVTVSKWAILLLSAGLIVLGVHGLWIYFSRLEVPFSENISKLFLAIQIPARFQDIIEWMSIKGIQSWFFPAVIITAGIILWQWGPRILGKIKYYVFGGL